MRSAHALTTTPLTGVRLRRRGPNAAWLLARLRAWSLDRRLADGAVPWRSPTYAARAVQLTSRHSRLGLARALEGLVERAEETPVPFRGAAIRPCREQVRHALPVILTLASRLRANDPLDARGIARLRALLGDGSGPCYMRIHPEALVVALEDVSQWLDVEE